MKNLQPDPFPDPLPAAHPGSLEERLELLAETVHRGVFVEMALKIWGMTTGQLEAALSQCPERFFEAERFWLFVSRN